MSFSKAWEGKKGVKAQDLKNKPANAPKPPKTAGPKQDAPIISPARKDDNNG